MSPDLSILLYWANRGRILAKAEGEITPEDFALVGDLIKATANSAAKPGELLTETLHRLWTEAKKEAEDET